MGPAVVVAGAAWAEASPLHMVHWAEEAYEKTDLLVVVDGVHSEGVLVMVGDGGNPPRADQGIKIPISSI